MKDTQIIFISLLIFFVIRSSFGQSIIKSIYIKSFKNKNINKLTLLLRIVLLVLLISSFLPIIPLNYQYTSYIAIALDNNYFIGFTIISYTTTFFVLFSQKIKFLKLSFITFYLGLASWGIDGFIHSFFIKDRTSTDNALYPIIFFFLPFASLGIYMTIFMPIYWTKKKFLTEGWVDSPVSKHGWISILKNIGILFLLIFIILTIFIIISLNIPQSDLYRSLYNK